MEADGQIPVLKTPADSYDSRSSFKTSSCSELPVTSGSEFETATSSTNSSRILSSGCVSDHMPFKEREMMSRICTSMVLEGSSESFAGSASELGQQVSRGSGFQDQVKPKEVRKWRIPTYAADQSSEDECVHNEQKADDSTSCSSWTVTSDSQESEENMAMNGTLTGISRDASPGPKEASESFNIEQPSTSAGNDLDDEYADWDPRAMFFRSSQNIKCPDAETTLKGVPHFKGAICPYSNAEGSCYKGTRCRCEHHIDQEKLAANPKLAIPFEPQLINHFIQLPLKIEGQPGFCFFAKLTCVNSIHDFYIVPVNSVYCECKKNDEDYIKLLGDKVYTLEGLTKDLKNYFLRNRHKYASSYGFLELALTRIVYNNEMGYYRVAIIEDSPIDSDEMPDVRCFFLDLGHTSMVNFGNLETLPRMFAKIPPLAYRCFLYGVTPTQLWGDSPADEFLRDTVGDKKVLLKIRQKGVQGDLTGYTRTEDIPYGVELYFEDSNGRYISLSDQLVDRCDAFRWGTLHESTHEEETTNESEDGDKEGDCDHDDCFGFLLNKYWDEAEQSNPSK